MKKIKNGLRKSVRRCLPHTVLEEMLLLNQIAPKSAKEIGPKIGRSVF